MNNIDLIEELYYQKALAAYKQARIEGFCFKVAEVLGIQVADSILKESMYKARMQYKEHIQPDYSE